MNNAHNEALPITPKLTPPKWQPGNHIPTCACKPCRHAYATTIIKATWARQHNIFGYTTTGREEEIDAIITAAETTQQ